MPICTPFFDRFVTVNVTPEWAYRVPPLRLYRCDTEMCESRSYSFLPKTLNSLSRILFVAGPERVLCASSTFARSAMSAGVYTTGKEGCVRGRRNTLPVAFFCATSRVTCARESPVRAATYSLIFLRLLRGKRR